MSLMSLSELCLGALEDSLQTMAISPKSTLMAAKETFMASEDVDVKHKSAMVLLRVVEEEENAAKELLEDEGVLPFFMMTLTRKMPCEKGAEVKAAVLAMLKNQKMLTKEVRAFLIDHFPILLILLKGTDATCIDLLYANVMLLDELLKKEEVLAEVAQVKVTIEEGEKAPFLPHLLVVLHNVVMNRAPGTKKEILVVVKPLLSIIRRATGKEHLLRHMASIPNVIFLFFNLLDQYPQNLPVVTVCVEIFRAFHEKGSLSQETRDLPEYQDFVDEWLGDKEDREKEEEESDEDDSSDEEDDSDCEEGEEEEEE